MSTYTTEQNYGLPEASALHNYLHKNGIVIVYRTFPELIEAIGRHFEEQVLEPSQELQKLLDKYAIQQ